MRKFLIASIAAACCSAPALAADMAVKAPPPLTPPPAPVYSWTGCYIGANTGGAWSHQSGTIPIYDGDPYTASFGSTADGWVYGGQIGCDYQPNTNWIVGIRGMWDGSNMKSSSASETFTTTYTDVKIDSFATVVGKLGYLLNPTLELYGLGGVAWVQDKYFMTDLSALSGEGFASNESQTGYDVGIGLSWMFAHSWDLFVEYDHMGFGSKAVTLSGLGGYSNETSTVDIKQNIDKVLIGIDARFGWGDAPAVRRN